MSYEYNLAGAMTEQTYPSGKVFVTEYDDAGRIAGVKRGTSYYAGGSPTDASNRIGYAPQGAVGTMKLGNGKWEHTVFNGRLQPTEIGLGATSAASDLLKLEYTYNTAGQANNNGNVRTQTITAPKTAGGILVLAQSYNYDALNRLSLAEELIGAASQWNQTYDIDRWGNRAVRNTSSYIPSPTLTPISTGSTDFSAFNQATNRLAMSGFVYDTSGNLTKDPNTPTNGILYDAENHQTSYTKSGPGGGTTGYRYDGDGRRVKKVVGSVTTIFVYNVAGQLIAEYTSDPVPPPQGGGGTSYLTSDHLGSTRVVTKENGSVKARYDYLPYADEIGSEKGNRTSVAGYGASDGTRQKFTQKERDNESGLDYFLARYYSSAQGRFTSPDEFAGGPYEFWVLGSGEPTKQALSYADIVNPQSLNKYQYTYGNPLRYVDPNGHAPDILVIENGPTEGNPIGHTAIAVTGYGVFSFGNDTDLGSSTSAYISKQAERRNTTLFVIKTTPEQDKAAVDALMKQDEKGGINRYPDNCSTRSNAALDAAGIPNVNDNVVGNHKPAQTEIPGSAAARATALKERSPADPDKVKILTLPKGSTGIPSEVKQFEPTNPPRDPRLPKPENKNKSSS